MSDIDKENTSDGCLTRNGSACAHTHTSYTSYTIQYQSVNKRKRRAALNRMNLNIRDTSTRRRLSRWGPMSQPTRPH